MFGLSGVYLLSVLTGRRINETDLLEVLGKVSSSENVQAFVCGAPPMTDAMVDVLTGH